MNKVWLLIIICIVSSTSLLAEDLTPIEQSLVDTTSTSIKSDGLKLLEQVVNINSGTFNRDGIKKVALVFKKEFDKLGFESKIIDVSAVNRGHHLFSEYKGANANKTILLVCHIDTVFEAQSPFQKFEYVSKHIVKGPGIIDNKGGCVLILESLKAIQKVNQLDKLHVVVALMGDEENFGTDENGSFDTTRKELINIAKRSDYALGYEPSFDNQVDVIVTNRRSFLTWQLNITTNSGHSSRIFTDKWGAGAIYPAAAILNQIYNEFRDEEYITVNAGIFSGAQDVSQDQTKKWYALGKPNIIPSQAVIQGDLRTQTIEQKEEALQRIQNIYANTTDQYNTEYVDTELITEFQTFIDLPPFPESTEIDTLLDMLNQINQEVGLPISVPNHPKERGGSDMSFVCKYTQAALDGLGLMGNNIHSHNEFLNIDYLEQVAQRNTLLLYRLATQP